MEDERLRAQMKVGKERRDEIKAMVEWRMKQAADHTVARAPGSSIVATLKGDPFAVFKTINKKEFVTKATSYPELRWK
jgi:hypothetical protein